MQTIVPPIAPVPLVPPSTLSLTLERHSYPIYIGTGLIQQIKYFEPHIKGQHIVIVSNTTVAPLYAEVLQKTLSPLNKKISLLILPDGEVYKAWGTLNKIFDHLIEHQADRSTTLIALGGGVIGDMTGFAAATYMRGIPFIQVPTTLLAQVDSSVGGKTGINHPAGKNMIGAFWQPTAVIADVDTLKSLPSRELSAGLAEVIKHGAIADAHFFSWLEKNIHALNQYQVQALAYVVQRSCEIKAHVVMQDERESGIRAILNFGHTFGHAIETALGYGVWLHGEAVGCGMVMASRLSVQRGYISEEIFKRIVDLIAAAQLPIVQPQIEAEKFFELMQSDKKVYAGEIRCVLLRALGEAFIEAVPKENLLEVIHHGQTV